MEIDIGKIDWALLRQQKEYILSILTFDKSNTSEDKDILNGIINLLDHIQDEAAKQLGNAAVFGPEENES